MKIIQTFWSGNKDADILITIVTNLRCTPCARMCKRINQLLDKHNNKICIQYIFSSFSDNQDGSAIFLTGIYLSDRSNSEKKKIYNNWFEYGKLNQKKFSDQYMLKAFHIDSKKEYAKHKEWNEKIDIEGTPIILINGYSLPNEYEVEDIVYFDNLKM